MPVWQHRVIKAGMFPTDLLFLQKSNFQKRIRRHYQQQMCSGPSVWCWHNSLLKVARFFTPALMNWDGENKYFGCAKFIFEATWSILYMFPDVAILRLTFVPLYICVIAYLYICIFVTQNIVTLYMTTIATVMSVGGWVSCCYHIKINICASCVREHLTGEKSISFGHCPNTPPPPPNSGKLYNFFWTSKTTS